MAKGYKTGGRQSGKSNKRIVITINNRHILLFKFKEL